MDGSSNISALWGPRPETPVSLARRWTAAIAALRSIDPVFANWFIARTEDDIVKLPENLVDLASTIEGERPLDPTLGYHLMARTDAGPSRGPNIFSLSVRGGSSYFNCVVLGTDRGQVLDPALTTYRILRAAFLVVCETFDAERAYAYPDALMPLWTRQDPRDANPDFPLAWLSYVAGRSANLVTPPPTAIVERRRGGGLLMAATNEAFDVANPAHIAVARDIGSSVAPLRSRPWQPEPSVS